MMKWLILLIGGEAMIAHRRSGGQRAMVAALLAIMGIAAALVLAGTAAGTTGGSSSRGPEGKAEFDPAYGGGSVISCPDPGGYDPAAIVSTSDSGFEESEAMRELAADSENLGKAFIFRKVNGEWVAEEVGELDPAVRKMMEEDYQQATGMTPYEALFGEHKAESSEPAQ